MLVLWSWRLDRDCETNSICLMDRMSLAAVFKRSFTILEEEVNWKTVELESVAGLNERSVLKPRRSVVGGTV